MASFLENVLVENGKWNKDSFSNHQPGTIYKYSNVGTALAAFIIEKATGKTFSNFTREYILNPLQMKDSGWSLMKYNFQNSPDCIKIPILLCLLPNCNVS
jgi:CubicO group peptidase (beta-lactamase class C family)